ncbi:uncharacterized protein L201_005793 [Kwoniella dendrophila CBS 6074]|uniref:Transcription factor CBF/NF-Y/archaeal histone domain-containing protein n=1 Tax=Kwoniella dendrophila CBS 6074 TaxID=1295534 RepID=A0AAX4JZI6_9TREE
MPPLRSKKSKQSRARIKRIMQLDEEVGKLASATPVMISKSLECFLQQLIDETCKETRSRGSKKMTAYHLKHMINSNETFDFLREIVETIPDPVISEPKAGPSSTPKPRKASNPNPNSNDSSILTASVPKKRTKKEKDNNTIDQLQGGGPMIHQQGYGNGQELSYGAYGHPQQNYSQNQYQQQQQQYQSQQHQQYPQETTPNNLPNIGTWRKDFTGTGGTGENGRGIFDDYEEDEDDY